MTRLELHTERLRLRRWTAPDRAAFAQLNRDSEVVEFLPGPLTTAQSDAFVDRIDETFACDGYGLWAVEVVGGPSFIGFVGLWPAHFEAHFTPAVEVGWRLARAQWGQGYATEAARASVLDGFERLGLQEIVSFTSVHNLRSRAVMQRLGMTHDPADDFDHPSLAPGHRLERHVLYRLRPPAADWG